MSYYREDRVKLKLLFHRINESRIVQDYISNICREWEILLYIFAMDCTKNVSETSLIRMHNTMQHQGIYVKKDILPYSDTGIPQADPLLYNNILLHILNTHKKTRINLVYNNQKFIDYLLILKAGNIRERCELLTSVVKDKKRFIFLRWILTCDLSIVPDFIDVSRLHKLRSTLREHNIRSPHFVISPNCHIYNKNNSVSLKSFVLTPFAYYSRLNNQRTHRSIHEIARMSINTNNFVPVPSEREKLYKFSKKTYKFVSGHMKWKMNPDSYFVQEAHRNRQEVMAGVSGHSEYMYFFTSIFQSYNAKLTTLINFLWLVPCQHHSAYEVLLTSVAYGIAYDVKLDPIDFLADLLTEIEQTQTA